MDKFISIHPQKQSYLWILFLSFGKEATDAKEPLPIPPGPCVQGSVHLQAQRWRDSHPGGHSLEFFKVLAWKESMSILLARLLIQVERLFTNQFMNYPSILNINFLQKISQ